MSNEKDMRPVAVPLWVLNEAMPAMLGVWELYKRMQAAQIETALKIDLARFEEAIEAIGEAMESVEPNVFAADPRTPADQAVELGAAAVTVSAPAAPKSPS